MAGGAQWKCRHRARQTVSARLAPCDPHQLPLYTHGRIPLPPGSPYATGAVVAVKLLRPLFPPPRLSSDGEWSVLRRRARTRHTHAHDTSLSPLVSGLASCLTVRQEGGAPLGPAVGLFVAGGAARWCGFCQHHHGRPPHAHAGVCPPRGFRLLRTTEPQGDEGEQMAIAIDASFRHTAHWHEARLLTDC